MRLLLDLSRGRFAILRAFLGAFVVAAILTPTPDPFNQCLMALPMYVFYEVGIISAGIFGRKKPEVEDVPAGVPASAGAKSGAVPAKIGAGTGDYVGVPNVSPRR